ncbi:MAG: TIGR03557 family F420-dependent LLM class oxidoreductase [Actinomycetota bacterium]|nr:TIGR03557 family F420-dependent LLM class oxidoreductase [Actinomycetota bacterium]
MTIEFGYWMSSEEHSPQALVRNAVRAEELGFRFAMVSDHFHPWVPKQGNSAFVWSVLGAIAVRTEQLWIATGVTGSIQRMHPAVVAHAAATVADMMPGRFALGLGTGERLNEHVTGEKWPTIGERQSMLEEYVEVIRKLWTGEEVTFRGDWYTVEQAVLFTRPDEPPPILVAAKGEQSAELAARIGDGLVATSPEAETVQTFEQAGGAGKPKHAQATLCWAEDEPTARRVAQEWFPNTALKGPLSTELARPDDFDAATEMVTEDDIAEAIPCGPDPDKHVDLIRQYVDAGFEYVYLHQVGPDQEGFFRFWQEELQPRLSKLDARTDVA